MKPFDVTCYSDEAEDVTMVRKAVYLDEVEKAIAALKEQNAQLQQSLANALLQVAELEEELQVTKQLMWE